MFEIEKDDDFFMKGTIDNAYIFVLFQLKKIYIQPIQPINRKKMTHFPKPHLK